MLTADQRSEFERAGLIRVPGAIAVGDAEAMGTRIWEDLEQRYGIRRDAPETWTMPRPSGFKALGRSGAFAPMYSAAVSAILDDLLGQSAWQRPRQWGIPLVTFPRGGRWDVPHSEWHLDFPVPPGAVCPGLRIFAFLSSVQPGGGGTVIVAGSHCLVQDLAARRAPTAMNRSADMRKALTRADPWLRALCFPDSTVDRVQRFMKGGTVVGDRPLRVVEMTGEPSDVVVTHPWMFHAAAPNCREVPRVMLTQVIYRG